MKYSAWVCILGVFCSVLCLSTAGCGPMPGEKQLVDVSAEYRGLDGQRVAVMVSADPVLLHNYPQAPNQVGKAVTQLIARHVPDVTTTIPDEIDAFQKKNPYWANMRYSELAQRMGVDRIVLIDLIEYQTHEPGNKHLWQGLISANVGVIATDAADADNFVFNNVVEARFPEDSTIGVIDSDSDTIQLGMVVLFARRAGGFFYDHQIEVDK